MRINTLEFRKCTYLCKAPDPIGWEICRWQPNGYYQREKEFIQDGDWYRPKDKVYSFMKIHKDCFKNPETCYQIASWDWNEDEYIFTFCADRPLDLTDSEWKDFKTLIKYGFEQLSKNEVSSDS